ncbi:carbohydrate ABC transporter permease [Alicyclobacillus dauci]|uniref:Sugar ABC transporter permease n=1 Tax=Alicyclobacillus dauci TaxID=1475485 RepID=A0ABY6Z3Z5_9BACL|nr:sugar ABC transporter permease [Alicyclobacillus dauci]WAH37590.1 sugar ABC transporter permease [Alicyclobacillus dauci]
MGLVQVGSPVVHMPRPRRFTRRAWQGYLMLLPSAVILLTFTIWPMIIALYHSLCLQDSAHPVPKFVGLANFGMLFHSHLFWQVMGNTFLFIVATVPVSLVAAMILAVMLNRRYRLTGFFRVALFHPTVLPLVSAASIWLFMYTPDYGLIDKALSAFGGAQLNWLGQPRTAIWAIIIMTIWKQLGYFVIFYLAGLQGIGKDPYEAADVDGASAWTTFWTITVPLLMSTTMFVFTIAMVDAFQLVDQLYVMTQGGPDNGTNMLLFYIYQQSFTYQNTGEASALSVILIAMLIFVAILQNVVDKRVHYES